MKLYCLGYAALAGCLCLPGTVSGTVHVSKKTIVPATSEKAQVDMYVMNMGSGIWPGEGENAYDLMMKWFGQGGRSIDSAWLYQDQPNISRAIRDSGLERKDVFITSKIPGCMGAKKAPGFIADNLQQLNTTYIDLVLIHWPQWVPWGQHFPPVGFPGDCAGTWQALEDSVSKGQARAIGVSQFNAAELTKLKKTWKVKPAVNQIQYNVFTHDDDAIKWCDTNGIMVEAWSPMGPYPFKPETSVFKDPTVTSIAKAHNVSNAQVALQWIVQRGHVFAVLSGNPAHQADDAGIFENKFTLTDGEVSKLNSLKKSDVTLV